MRYPEKIRDDSCFFLVGGTALALQIGHRFSVDLDLFTINAFDTQSLLDHKNLFKRLEEAVKDTKKIFG